jgi:hypothetical protein
VDDVAREYTLQLAPHTKTDKRNDYVREDVAKPEKMKMMVASDLQAYRNSFWEFRTNPSGNVQGQKSCDWDVQMRASI